MISFKDLNKNKGGLWILIIAAVILEATAVLQYYYSEHIIQIASEQIVKAELRRMDTQVDALADSTQQVQLDFIVEQMKQFPNCSYTLTDADGTLLLPPPDTIGGKKYHTFRQEVGTTGWQMSVLIPDSDLYGKLRRLGGLVTVLMLLGLVLLVFIIYRSAKNILSLIHVEESKQRIEGELQAASNIQMAMLPKTFPPYPDREDLNMYGIIVPAKEVGGDLFDFYVRDNRLLFCIGDVSGKGVPASLVMAVTRSLFRTTSAHENDAAKIVSAMNEAMADMNEQNMFVTFFLGVMNLENGQLNYCNAGHNAPIVVESKKSKEKSLITEKTEHTRLSTLNEVVFSLSSKNKRSGLSTIPNIPLGILAGYKFEGQQTTLKAGDGLFLYTDGLTEAENEHHELFGEDRMMAVAETWTTAHTSRERIEMMQQAVSSFVGNAEQSDDLTMLSIIWTPQIVERGKTASLKDESSKIFHLTMRNDIQQIPTLAEWVETLPIPQELNMTINLALEEAVSNVMLYAYPNSHGKVEISAEIVEREKKKEKSNQLKEEKKKDESNQSKEEKTKDESLITEHNRLSSFDFERSDLSSQEHTRLSTLSETVFSLSSKNKRSGLSTAIVFTIEDTGIAFDPTKQQEPNLSLSAEERPIGGLGIHLVRQIMDEIHYERKDGKNILTLTKKL